MTKRVLAMGIVLAMLGAAAWAAPRKGGDRADPQWWPGEGPGARPDNAVTGKVTHVDANRIALQTRHGAVEFVVTEQTKVVVRGERARITDVKQGDVAIVRFAVASDGTRTALGVRVPKPQAAGQITAISGNTITLEGREEAWNVTLAPDAKIISHGYAGTIEDLRIGYWAAARGTIDGSDVLATAVHFQPAVIRGVVQQVNGYAITVQTIRQKVIGVTASDATVVLVRPRTAPNQKGTLADVKPNMAVNIGGHITGENTMQSLWIDLLVGGQDGSGGAPAKQGRRTRR